MCGLQAEVLNLSGVLDDQRHLVYCAPTSGGKSLVAEVLMLRRVLGTGRPALLVSVGPSACVGLGLLGVCSAREAVHS